MGGSLWLRLTWQLAHSSVPSPRSYNATPQVGALLPYLHRMPWSQIWIFGRPLPTHLALWLIRLQLAKISERCTNRLLGILKTALLLMSTQCLAQIGMLISFQRKGTVAFVCHNRQLNNYISYKPHPLVQMKKVHWTIWITETEVTYDSVQFVVGYVTVVYTTQVRSPLIKQ